MKLRLLKTARKTMIFIKLFIKFLRNEEGYNSLLAFCEQFSI